MARLYKIARIGENSFWPELAYLVMSVATTVTDEIAMTLSLPEIQDELGLSAMYSQWIETAFWLGTAAAAIPLARLGQRVGVVLFLAIHFGLFIMCYVGMYFVRNYYALVCLRFVAGIITAGLISNRNFIASTYCSHEQRQSNINRIQVLNSVVELAAPFIGALINQYAGWRWIFIFCASCAVISGLTLFVYENPPRVALKFDVLGAALIAGASAAFCAIFTLLAVQKWYLAIILVVTLAICIAGLVFWERRFENPILPLSVVEKPIIWIICLNLINYVVLAIKTFILPQYISSHGMSVMVAALIAAGSCLIGVIVALCIQYLAAKFLYWHLLVAVYSLMCLSIIVLIVVLRSTTGFIVAVLFSSIFVMAGMFLTYPMLMQVVPESKNELVSGLPTTSRTIGNSIAFCAASSASYITQSTFENTDFGYQIALIISVVLSLLGIVISLFGVGNLVTEKGKWGFKESKAYNKRIWNQLQQESASGDAEALIITNPDATPLNP